MRIICGKCQSAFNLNLDGIHLQRFQFKCPSCAGLVLVDRAEAPAPIKVAGAPAVLVPIGSQAAPASKPAATPPPASEPQAIITPPPPRRAETPLTPPPASSPAAASVASPADDELPNAKFREAPTDRVGAVTPPKAVESPSVPAGPVRGAVAATAAAAPAALALPPIPPSAAASVAAKLPPREPRPVVAAKVEPASASATAAKAVSPAKPADPSPARAADKPDKVEPARPAGAEGIEAARAEVLAQHAELMKKNWFELLGVKQDAPLDEIKSAYFKLAKQYHPDRFVATMSESELAKVRELSSRVNQAFQDLRSDASRQEYIKKLIDPEREKKRLEASAIIEAMIDHEKGRAALKQSNFEQALQHFQRAAALHPGEAEYHFMIAQSLQRARGVENSSNRAAIESELRKAVDLQPNNAGYRIGIGHYWKARGEPEKALGHYKEALKLDPKNHEAIREIRLFESRKEKAREERKRAAPPGGRSGLGVRFGLR